jgi:predicted aspartyl protease
MGDDMGTFRVTVEIENPARSGVPRTLESVLVDTGAELSWFPAALLESLGIERVNQRRFRQADGTVLARWTGGVIVRVVGIQTWDEAVFAEPGDLILLGAHSLEGLNLRIDPVSKQLIDAGPAPAAATARHDALGSRQLGRAVDRDARVGCEMKVNGARRVHGD